MQRKKPRAPRKNAKRASPCKHRIMQRRGKAYVCSGCGADVTKMAKKLKPAVERDEPFFPEAE